MPVPSAASHRALPQQSTNNNNSKSNHWDGKWLVSEISPRCEKFLSYCWVNFSSGTGASKTSRNLSGSEWNDLCINSEGNDEHSITCGGVKYRNYLSGSAQCNTQLTGHGGKGHLSALTKCHCALFTCRKLLCSSCAIQVAPCGGLWCCVVWFGSVGCCGASLLSVLCVRSPRKVAQTGRDGSINNTSMSEREANASTGASVCVVLPLLLVEGSERSLLLPPC